MPYDALKEALQGPEARGQGIWKQLWGSLQAILPLAGPPGIPFDSSQESVALAF